jgi:hypothetical protein
MRALTDAEARTVAVLLGAATAPERERLQRTALPRSTYHAARRKAYEGGWLRDRYVPQPERFHLPYAVFLLARPFADRQVELADRWDVRPENVVLLRGRTLLFGVFLAGSLDAARAVADGEGWSDLTSGSTSVVADLHGPSVPVYFDFEGLWAHLAGTSGTIGYPRGLGGSPPPEEGSRPLSEHQIWAAAELVHRPFVEPTRALDGHLVGPLGLPFSQRKLVATGTVNHRVFLDPSKPSAYRGNAADLYVFTTGTLRPDARPAQLFQTLVRECQVFPFLYVVGADRLLIGAMGRAVEPARPSGAPAKPPPALAGRRPVMPTLQESIEGIEILQEPARQCELEVDHRYDRLIERRPSA